MAKINLSKVSPSIKFINKDAKLSTSSTPITELDPVLKSRHNYGLGLEILDYLNLVDTGDIDSKYFYDVEAIGHRVSEYFDDHVINDVDCLNEDIFRHDLMEICSMYYIEE